MTALRSGEGSSGGRFRQSFQTGDELTEGTEEPFSLSQNLLGVGTHRAESLATAICAE